MKRKLILYFVITILLFSTVTVFAVTNSVVTYSQYKNEVKEK